jgi:uncharacterized protein YjdB
VATVSSSGVVTAVAPGTAQIVALVDGISGTATVTVRSVPVASVQISAPSTSVPAGGSLQLTAQTRDAAGAVLSGRAVTWTSANTAVATVDNDGRVTGVGSGQADVRATSEGVTSSVTITVTPVVRVTPATVTLRDRGNANREFLLVATDQNGRPLPPSGVTWSSSDPAVATVDGAGLVRGVSSGSGTATATITARYQGATGSATVTVTRN